MSEETLATQRQGVFAGGDVVTGPKTVLDAMGAGKLAAEMIDKHLRGEARRTRARGDAAFRLRAGGGTGGGGVGNGGASHRGQSARGGADALFCRSGVGVIGGGGHPRSPPLSALRPGNTRRQAGHGAFAGRRRWRW